MNFTPRDYAAQLNSPCHLPRGTKEGKPQKSISRARLMGSRVLIVEDEFIIALEIQSILEEAGAAVIGPALTLAQAVELAVHENFSAATLDLRLGRESIAPVATILAERHIPFLFYTGQPASDPVRRSWPDARVLSKPAAGDEIARAIAEIIRTKH